jgi:hypothetical protein
VLAAIPYLVGYRPSESMILLGMRRRQVIFTARIDLPEADSSRTELGDTADQMLSVLSRQNLTGVLLVGFGSEARVAPLAFTLRLACLESGLDVLEVLRADHGRYWSYLCDDPRCCPEDGAPYDDRASAVAAEWTVAGRVVLPDRETYEQQLRPLAGLSRSATRRATMLAGDRMLALLRQSVDEDDTGETLVHEAKRAIDAGLARLRSDERLTDDEVAWLSVLAVSDEVRHTAMSRIRTAGDQLDLHRVMWMDVVRRTERDLTPAAGCLFAFAAWRCGDGALAKLALELVLEVDPCDELANTMHEMLNQGVPPAAFDRPPRSRLRRRSGRRPRRRSSSRRAGSRRA